MVFCRLCSSYRKLILSSLLYACINKMAKENGRGCKCLTEGALLGEYTTWWLLVKPALQFLEIHIKVENCSKMCSVIISGSWKRTSEVEVIKERSVQAVLMVFQPTCLFLSKGTVVFWNCNVRSMWLLWLAIKQNSQRRWFLPDGSSGGSMTTLVQKYVWLHWY